MKLLHTFFIVLILVLSLFFVVAKASAVVPPQCWEAGCCGPQLKFNQWSCVTSSFKCSSGWGGWYYASYYCSGSTKTHDTFDSCDADCPGDPNCATKSCLTGWAKFCETTEGSKDCDAGDNSCTATFLLKQCEEKADGSDCIFRDSTDTRDCWVGGAMPTPVPGASPTPPTTPPPIQFPQTIKVIGVVFEDENNNGILDKGEQVLGPRGGVTGYQYLTAIGNPRTVDCDSQAHELGKVKEAIDGPFAIQHVKGSTVLGDAAMCYGGYIQINSQGHAFIEGSVDCSPG